MRKTAQITITDDGRDKGKVFLITEMSAVAAEKWATRALLALARSGVDLPEDIGQAGLAGVAVMGVKALAGLNFADAEPLMDEMWGCVQIMPDPSRPNVLRPLIEDDTEEVVTRIRLRAEVFSLHTGFSIAGALSNPTSETAPAASLTTRTSRTRSGR